MGHPLVSLLFPLCAIGVLLALYMIWAVRAIAPKEQNMNLVSQIKANRASSEKPGTGATGPAKVVHLKPTEDLGTMQARGLTVVVFKGEVVAVTFAGSDQGLPFRVEKCEPERRNWWKLFYQAGRQGSIRKIERVSFED